LLVKLYTFYHPIYLTNGNWHDTFNSEKQGGFTLISHLFWLQWVRRSQHFVSQDALVFQIWGYHIY
jgi:hypothetical protein